MVIGEFVHNPVNQLPQLFTFDRPTGFADGGQHTPSPFLRTALVERTHQQTVRCADDIDVAGMPLAAAHLTIAESQRLLTVPMKRLGAGPAVPVHQHHADDLPRQSVTPQGFARWPITARSPTPHNPYGVLHIRHPHLFAEIPVTPIAHAHGLFGLPGYLARHRLKRLFPSLLDPLAVELQIAYIQPLLTLNVVEHLGAGDIAIEREVACNTTGHGIVDQLDTPLGVILENVWLTRVSFVEPAPFKGIGRAPGTDVVGDQVIMGDDVALVGMVPKPAHVFNPFAGMIHQGIVDGHHPARAITRFGASLPPLEAPVVERLGVPGDLAEPTVQAGLMVVG
jgi:hypothetical protein